MAALNSTGANPQLEAAVQTFAKSIGAPLGFAITTTAFSATLIPILAVLFYFSTPTSRRRPVFILNVASILLGIVIAIWSNFLMVTSILHPFQSVSSSNTATFIIFFGFAPWLAELVLVVRLLAVFPPTLYSIPRIIAVLAFPCLVKAARLAVLAAYYHMVTEDTKQIGVPYQVAESIDYKNLPFMKIEWLLQILDSGYCTIIFIWRLRQTCGLRERHSLDGTNFGDTASFGAKLKILFWVAAENSVVPLILNTALLVDVYVDPNYHANTVYLLFTNYYICIISVVFATIWSSTFPHRHHLRVTDDVELSLSFAERNVVHILQSGTEHKPVHFRGPPADTIILEDVRTPSITVLANTDP